MALRKMLKFIIPGGIGFNILKTIKDNTTIRPTEVEKDLQVNAKGLLGVKKEILIGDHAIKINSRNTASIGKVDENVDEKVDEKVDE